MNRPRLMYGLRLSLELAALIALCVAGGQLADWLGLPVPGGVVGLVLLLAVFASGRVQPAALQLGAGVLLAEMLLFFIPPMMSLLDHAALVREAGVRIVLVIGVSTVLVMVATAVTVEWLCRRGVMHEH